MSLYRNLGPITFLVETELYEIFQTSNQTLILQLKQQNCDNNFDIQTLISNFLSIQPTLNLPIVMYSEKGKPQSIILSDMSPFKFKQISIQDLCNVIQVVIKVIRSWEQDKVGEIHQDLFFSFHGKLIFFSLPLVSPKSSLKTKVFNFIEKITSSKQVSHQLLLKRLKQCKNIEGILQQTRYFAKISNLKLAEDHSKSRVILFKQKTFINQQKAKSVRRKYILFKKNDNDSCLTKSASHQKEFSFGKQIDDINSHKVASRAIHISNSTHLSNRSNKGLHKSQSLKPHAYSLRMNGMNHYQSQKKDFYNSFTKSLKKNSSHSVYKEIKKTNKKYKNTPINQNHKQNIQNSNINKNINLNSTSIKDLVNKSILKWSDNKLIIKNEGDIENKKKLKKTGHIIQQHQYEFNNSFEAPEVTIQLQMESQKPANNDKNVLNQKQCKKTRPIIDKIPLKGHGQDLANKNSYNIESLNKNSLDEETKRKKFNEEKDTKAKVLSYIEQLNYIGETVVNTSLYLKKFQKIFWQLPMFFLYKFFYIERVNIENMGYYELKEENQSVQKALKKLLSVVLKKIQKEEGMKNNQNILRHLNMNPNESLNDYQNFRRYILKQYINSLVDFIDQQSELELHLIEVVDSFLTTEGQIVQVELRNKVQKDKQYQQIYLKSRLQIAQRKLSFNI